MTGPGGRAAAPPFSERLTVILVNYRSLANIEARLRSGVLDQHDVIVVDNGDDPEGVTQLCATAGATAVLLDTNVGFAAAINRAVADVDRPNQRWLLLNPDAELTADQLQGLGRVVAEGADGAAPLLVGADGRLQIGAGGGPLTATAVAAYFLFVSHLLPVIRGVFLTRRQSRSAHRVEWLCMACLVLRPDVFNRFGLIPEDEIVYAEDVAWGTRATAMGARFELVPEFRLRHEQGASGSSDRWAGALERLCRARLGRVRGSLAVAALRLGLAIRRIAGRRVR